jgi:hypothetical protein
MEIVVDNREKKGNYDDFVPVKRFKRERDLQQPHESVF